MFTSRYVRLLERENTRLRLENERLLNRILEMAKPEPIRVATHNIEPGVYGKGVNVPGRKTWAAIQAEAVAENAKAEAQEKSNGIQG